MKNIVSFDAFVQENIAANEAKKNAKDAENKDVCKECGKKECACEKDGKCEDGKCEDGKHCK